MAGQSVPRAYEASSLPLLSERQLTEYLLVQMSMSTLSREEPRILSH